MVSVIEMLFVTRYCHKNLDLVLAYVEIAYLRSLHVTIKLDERFS